MYNKYIYAIHGVVDHIDESKPFQYRNCIETKNYIKFLNRLPHPARDLSTVTTHGGIAITVDDSTNGSLKAALIAKEMGHEVALFINPHNITTGEPYWFHRLSLLLDYTLKKSVTLYQKDFSLANYAEKKKFRDFIKTKFRKIQDEEYLSKEIEKIQKSLKVEDIILPDFLQPPRLSALKEAASLGVAMENHFWYHYDVNYCNEEDFSAYLFKTKQWINENINQESNFFAAPFGESIPLNITEIKNAFSLYLTCDSRFHNGFIGAKIFNRFGLNNNRIIKNTHEGYLPYSY